MYVPLYNIIVFFVHRILVSTWMVVLTMPTVDQESLTYHLGREMLSSLKYVYMYMNTV
jgi:hypothetical protein